MDKKPDDLDHGAASAAPRAASCPICRADGHVFLSVNGYDIRRCSSCAVDFVANPPTDAQLKEYYDRAQWFEGAEHGGYASYDEQTDVSPPWLVELLDRIGARKSSPSVLDVGCAYGTHLALARSKGWQCFGVEPSQHAREVALERHRGIYLTETLQEIPPHRFDLVLILDVIEHLADPYKMFYDMFAAGQIGPETVVAMTTPNARSASALNDPKGWQFRHPPSHLTYYSGAAFQALLTRLRFGNIRIEGQHPLKETAALHPDEDAERNQKLVGYAGLLVIADGSDFAHFMQERYVPGTWSELTAYEHLPRYALAKQYARGRSVLDFGCGTGYGAAGLASVADSVLAVDIDDSALAYARLLHRADNLTFQRNDTFCEDLPAASFDFVSCFEVIEHIRPDDQQRLLRSFSRLLKPDGVLLLSTPNPAVTALYGENEYHLKEMDEQEFRTAVAACFEHRVFMAQTLISGAMFTPQGVDVAPLQLTSNLLQPQAAVQQPTAAVWVALCSHAPIEAPANQLYIDNTRDYVSHRVDVIKTHNKNLLHRYEAFRGGAQAMSAEQLLVAAGRDALKRVDNLVPLGTLRNQFSRAADDTVNWMRSGLHRVRRRLGAAGDGSLGADTSDLVAEFNKEPVWDDATGRYALIDDPLPAPPSGNAGDGSIYVVRPKHLPDAGTHRPTILHFIPNVFVGGSTQLIIDLVEHLSDQYQHEVVASALAPQGMHAGLPVHQLRLREMRELPKLLRRISPDLVHIHYWGLSDDPWYKAALEGVRSTSGIPIVENINTPIAPLIDKGVDRYVFVSNYVRNEFASGLAGALTEVIHPGIDLSRFSAPFNGVDAENAIGMVYRLERDKLAEDSIDLLIEVVKRRPRTRAYVIGGGGLLRGYMQRTVDAGVRANFRFTGYVPYETLPGWYDRFSVFVAPVWKESFGQVAPLAMSKRITVGGYRVGALPEIIGTSEPLGRDLDEAAARIVEALNDPESCKAEGVRLQERAHAMFSVEGMCRKYATLYGELLAERTEDAQMRVNARTI